MEIDGPDSFQTPFYHRSQFRQVHSVAGNGERTAAFLQHASDSLDDVVIERDQAYGRRKRACRLYREMDADRCHQAGHEQDLEPRRNAGNVIPGDDEVECFCGKLCRPSRYERYRPRWFFDLVFRVGQGKSVGYTVQYSTNGRPPVVTGPE